MGIPRTEDPSWACPSDMLDVHGLVKEDFSRGKEYSCVHSMPYHLANLPKIINIGWGVSVSEPKFTSDFVKADFRHELSKAIGAWISLLFKGVDTPKIVPLPSRAGVY